MTPRPTHYIDFAAYRRKGAPAKAARTRRVDWFKVCALVAAVSLGLSFWAWIWLVTR